MSLNNQVLHTCLVIKKLVGIILLSCHTCLRQQQHRILVEKIFYNSIANSLDHLMEPDLLLLVGIAYVTTSTAASLQMIYKP